MQSLWNDKKAQDFQDDQLQLRAYSSRLLGENDQLILHGGGNTSIKVSESDIYGEQRDVLYIKGSGHDLKTIEVDGFTPVDLKYVKKLATLEKLSDSEMITQMKLSMLNPNSPLPSVETILHALIPFKFVDHTHSDAVVTITNTEGSVEKLREIYGDDVLVLDYTMPGFILSKYVYEKTLELDWQKTKAIILLHHGIFTFHDEASVSYQNMIDLVTKAEDYIKEKGCFDVDTSSSFKSDPALLDLAKMRKMAALKMGESCILKFKDDPLSTSFSAKEDVASIATKGPVTPDHVIQTKRIPAILGKNWEEDFANYIKDYQQYFERNQSADLVCLDPSPRFAIWKNTGVVVMAENHRAAKAISNIADHTMKSICWGQSLGGWNTLGEKEIFDLEYWELEQAKLKRIKSVGQLQGKVAVVSGSASGIGLSCTKKLLNEGACVVGFDIDPKIKSCVDSPNYLGICVDLTVTEEIKNALAQCIKNFGGIDILVSNAGIFPKSAPIKDLSDELWEKSVSINLSSHFKLLRETIPYLEHGMSPCVVLMGSKNVPAPGPGAASYSAAKAALTQLARVAALELGEKGIRVNTVHPNAVYDTAIWTDEVLNARAKHYGLTVEEYKKNNVLKSEVTSSGVANLVFQLTTDNFSNTTGAQIPIDGGNDRVI